MSEESPQGGSKRRSRATTPAAERFSEKVRVEENGCWIWQGQIDRHGYARMSVDNKSVLVHRWAYSQWRGQIQSNLMALHSCHNRDCVNPDHIRPGTAADNMKDCVAAGRAGKTRGERQWMAYLTEADVREIRRLRSEGVKLQEIAERFGSTKSTIFGITKRTRWGHVA